MNNEPEKNSITDKVLNKIKSGEVKMKSKTYFILRMVLLILSTLVLIFFIIYFVSFIIFSLRASGVLFLPKFGFPGIKIFLNSLPWLLIFISAILIILLEIFAKKFTFVYRRPILYSLLAIIMIVVIGSLLVEKTPFHSNLFWKTQEGHLPIMRTVYRDFGVPRTGNIYHGVISEVVGNDFKIETPRGEILAIVVSSKTRPILETDIKEGDAIVVLGERKNGIIQALDIRKVKKDSNLFRSQRMRGYKLLVE